MQRLAGKGDQKGMGETWACGRCGKQETFFGWASMEPRTGKVQVLCGECSLREELETGVLEAMWHMTSYGEGTRDA